MTLHELIEALANIVADGKSEVVIDGGEIYAHENDVIELKPEYVEKIGGHIVIHASEP